MATKIRNPFEDLRIQHQDIDKSLNWYRKQIKELGYNNMKPSEIMKDQRGTQRRLYPGRLYLYYYDPKHKDTLPYYDTFPLVYPYRLTPDGFMGYNLHYLPPAIRVRLMGELMNINRSPLSDERKLGIAYTFLNSRDANKYLAPCVKRYLNSHFLYCNLGD